MVQLNQFNAKLCEVMVMNTKEFNINIFSIENLAPYIYDGLECVLVIKGCLELEVDRETYLLKQDDLFVINHGQIRSMTSKSLNIALVLKIDREYLRKNCQEEADSFILCKSDIITDKNSTQYYWLKRTLTKMNIIFLKKERGHNIEFKSYLFRFLNILYKDFGIMKSSQEDNENKNKRDAIASAITYINENYYKTIRLEEIAKMEFMSSQYFSRYFKQKTGCNFLQYLQILRVNKSMTSLLYSNDSISKIATEYGFANTKAYFEAFKKVHNMAPGAYREKNHGAAVIPDKLEEFNTEPENGIIEFLRYVKKYDFKDRSFQPEKSYNINLKSEVLFQHKKHDNILNIERLDLVYQNDLLQNINSIKNDLCFRFIYFQMPFDKLALTPSLATYYNEFMYIVNAFQKHALFPFIKITPDAANTFHNLMEDDQIVSELENSLKPILLKITENYEMEYWKNWKFEIAAGTVLNIKKTAIFYMAAYSIIERIMPGVSIGMSSLTDSRLDSPDYFSKTLEYGAQYNCLPGFFTFSFDPVKKTQSLASDEVYFDSLKHYCRQKITEIKEIYEGFGLTDVPLYMISWNTLQGRTPAEYRVYYRAALIIDTLKDIGAEIAGAGYWYETNTPKLAARENLTNSLSLYIFHKARRPVYSVIEALNRMYANIIFVDENIIAARNDFEEYTVLLWNPCYINPASCHDSAILEYHEKLIKLTINGLSEKPYIFKKIIMDREHSGMLGRHYEVGYPDFMDQEVIEYMQYSPTKGLAIFEDKATDGSYTISEKLSYNSVCMYIIKPKKQADI